MNSESKKSNLGIQKGTGEKPKQTADSVVFKTATQTPKRDLAKGVHKADPRVAPKTSGDFSTNPTSGDQSTESNPEASTISYEPANPDQSTENNPEDSSVSYESHNQDQSTENQDAYVPSEEGSGDYQ